MPTAAEYRELGVGSPCPQCLTVRAAIRAQEPDAEYIYDGDVGELIIKHGKYGEFIACSIRCGYTRSIPGRSILLPTAEDWKVAELKKKCPTCSGTGYIPFIKPDGAVSQYAQLLCPDCGGYDHKRDYADGNMPDRQPDDFDFACSDDYRALYQGEQFPEEAPTVPIADTLNDRRWDSVQQLRAQVQWLSNKVTEVRVRAKRAQPSKKQGIDI